MVWRPCNFLIEEKRGQLKNNVKRRSQSKTYILFNSSCRLLILVWGEGARQLQLQSGDRNALVA
jgi:hypothetical protein